MELQSTAVLWWTLLSSYRKRDCRSTWWISQKLKERSNTKWVPPQVLIASCCFFGLLVDSIASRKDWVSVRWSNAFVLLGVLSVGKKTKQCSISQGPFNLLTTSFKVNQIMEGSKHYSGICKLIWAVKKKNNPQKGREIHLEPSINVCSFYGMLNTIPISLPHKEVRYYY